MYLTGLDVILIIVMLLSALLAMVRGMTREVLSIASWVAGAVATIYFFPMFRDSVRDILQPNWLADIVLALGIFIVTLMIVSFITMRISDFILSNRRGPIGRRGIRASELPSATEPLITLLTSQHNAPCQHSKTVSPDVRSGPWIAKKLHSLASSIAAPTRTL